MDFEQSNWLDRLHITIQWLLIIICGVCVLFTISLESAEIFVLIIIIWFMVAVVLGVIYLFLRYIIFGWITCLFIMFSNIQHWPVPSRGNQFIWENNPTGTEEVLCKNMFYPWTDSQFSSNCCSEIAKGWNTLDVCNDFCIVEQTKTWKKQKF